MSTTRLHLNGVMGVPWTFVAKAKSVLYAAADQILIAPPHMALLKSDRQVNLVAPPHESKGEG